MCRKNSVGGSDLLEMRIAVNWTGATTDGGIEKSLGQTQNNTFSQVVSFCATTLQPGDNIRPIFVNRDDASNIIINKINMVVGSPK